MKSTETDSGIWTRCLAYVYTKEKKRKKEKKKKLLFVEYFPNELNLLTFSGEKKKKKKEK